MRENVLSNAGYLFWTLRPAIMRKSPWSCGSQNRMKTPFDPRTHVRRLCFRVTSIRSRLASASGFSGGRVTPGYLHRTATVRERMSSTERTFNRVLRGAGSQPCSVETHLDELTPKRPGAESRHSRHECPRQRLIDQRLLPSTKPGNLRCLERFSGYKRKDS
jgi:hypothetical protein